MNSLLLSSSAQQSPVAFPSDYSLLFKLGQERGNKEAEKGCPQKKGMMAETPPRKMQETQ